MQKFNFNAPILQLDATPYKDEKQEDLKMNKVLANNLITCTTFSDYIKLMEWARKLWSTGVLELDKSDIETLKRLIISIQNMYPIVKEQLLSVFEKPLNTPQHGSGTGNKR